MVINNTDLIDNQKKRLTFIISGIIFLAVYLLVIVFQLTSAYYHNKSKNDEILYNSVRLQTLFTIYGDLESAGEEVIQTEVVQDILRDYYVYSEDEIILDNINTEFFRASDLPFNQIIRSNGNKIYKTSFIVGDGRNIIAISVQPYKTLLEELGLASIIFLIVSPLIFGGLSYGIYKFLNRMYQPLKEIVANLESFASNINHEFKTSLSEIISSLELAKVTGEYGEANMYSIQSARRLNSMLDSLGMLIHFVNSDYRKERINIRRVLDDSIEDFTSMLDSKHIKIIRKYDINAPVYKYIDKSPLVLCFQNILKNAIKFSHPGGNIEIYIGKESFWIKDYGVGIAKENIDKIFHRYFRESYAKDGNGIGLSIIRHITGIYDWNVDIDSEKGKYTKVRVDI